MSETSIVRGRIDIQPHLVHGAVSGVVTYFDNPEEWEMKQFVSQEQLEQFALVNMLEIARKTHE